MLMDSDAVICVITTLIREVGVADGGLGLSLHPGITPRVNRFVRRSDVINLWTSEVHQETSDRSSHFTHTPT